MSALNPMRLKGEPFGANPAAGDYSSNSQRVMQNNTPSSISTITTSTTSIPVSPPHQFRFPDVPPPALPSPSSAGSSPSESFPSDSPPSASSSSSSASASSSSLSQRPLIFAPQALQPASPLLSISDFYLPTLTPDEILDTLDHLASLAPKKKSHARKQPAGHIPRPRNAFILFRCLFVSQQAVPASVEKDHRNISRIAGKVWKSMSNEQRDPWVKASELEKTRHEARFPNYRYNPVQTQVLPRRFAQQAVFKSPPPADNGSNNGNGNKPVLRVRPKMHDDDDDFCDLSSSSSSVVHEDHDGNGNGGHGLELHHPGYTPAPFYADHSHAPPQFTHPFAPPYSPAPPPPPPDSPPPATHLRLAARRSSSCPPLPPLAAASFPFNNPNPWLAQSVQAWAQAPAPFAYASFPAPGPGPEHPHNPHHPHDDDDDVSLDAQAEHRPLTAPAQDLFSSSFAFPAPAPAPAPAARFGNYNYNNYNNYTDTHTRLAHRRGSSLDRAIASSSIAGAFGGGGGGGGGGLWARRPSQAQVYYDYGAPLQSSGEATPTEFASSSEDAGEDVNTAGTPALSLSLSPQSSFEHEHEREGGYGRECGREYGRERGRSGMPRALADAMVVVRDDEDGDEGDVGGGGGGGGAGKGGGGGGGRGGEEHSLSAFGGRRLTPPTLKIPARLFGSQGARLGLDLDLDASSSFSYTQALLMDTDTDASPPPPPPHSES